MEVTSLSRSAIKKLWFDFANELGLVEMRKRYGAYWPRDPVEGELVFMFANGEKIIGWTSIRRDPVDPVAWLTMGVFPQFQNQGFSKELYKWIVKHAFKLWPLVSAVFFMVAHENPLLRRMISHPKIHWVGHIEYPMACEIFATHRSEVNLNG